MNAKKIMGAVLVALLAAALFVGAGAAAETNLGTVFLYQDMDSTSVTVAGTSYNIEGTWQNGDYSITIDSNGKVTGDNVVAGTYKKGDYSLYVTLPTAKYSATGTLGTIPYIVGNDGKVYLKSTLNLDAVAAAPGITITNVLVTFPDGKVSNMTITDFEGNFEVSGLLASKGTYKVQALFPATSFIEGTNSQYLVDTLNSFTFTVVGTEDATISASVDTVYSGEYVTFTIEGTLGVTYKLELDGFEIAGNPVVALTADPAGQTKVYKFEMPNSGVATFQFKVDAEDEATVVLLDNANKEIETVEITVSAPVITATLGATSYFIGDEIEISGTSTSGAELFFSIKGTNFKETLLTMDEEEFGKTWEAKLLTEDVYDNGKKLDVGTYTINIYQGIEPADQNAFERLIAGDNGDKPVKTVVVALKQPFVSIIEAPEVIVQGTKAEFVINAEAAPNKVKVYVFGTNYFLGSEKIAVTTDKDVNNKFTAKLTEDQTSAKNMSAGQYFMVIQHPMYDGAFNIANIAEDFYLNTTGNVIAGGNAQSFLFNVNERQTANAAQALCDALDTQNIDDMYVKYSFFVVGEDESFTISDIPSQIAKGTTLVISGVDTANADETVVVEMISTAFAAVPKETVGSAAFIAVTTTVAEDGTWEVTLDTSELNIDEYNLAVKIADETKKNVKINVVAAADEPVTPPTDEPGQDEPGQDEPVAPETPGFGALAALAGLGAVAVLLLRRE